LISEEAPLLEVKEVHALIEKFQFCGDIAQFDSTGYDKAAIEALGKLKQLFEALYSLGIKKE